MTARQDIEGLATTEKLRANFIFKNLITDLKIRVKTRYACLAVILDTIPKVILDGCYIQDWFQKHRSCQLDLKTFSVVLQSILCYIP